MLFVQFSVLSIESHSLCSLSAALLLCLLPFAFYLLPFFLDHLKAARPLLKQSAVKAQRSLTAALKLAGVKPRCLNFTIFMPVMLMVFLMAPGAHSAQVTLAWDSNQENDLAGYRLYYGSASRNYSQVIDVGNNNQHKVSGLAAGATYYFAVTAYNLKGYESDYSTELAHTTSIITYTITASAGANGSITPAGPVTANQGTNQTFSIHPDQNFQVLNVKVDGVALGTVTNYTFNNISADHTIEAEFAYIGPAPAADSDNDGVPDDQDDFPYDPAETTDTDGDGQGDNADTDDDNDGMPDVWEMMQGLNPFINDAAGDPDADGVSNLNEFLGATDPDAFEAFFKPNQPGQLSPADGEVVSLTPVLRTGAFSDPDRTDIHTTSRWQIYRSDNQVCVFDKSSHAALTELVVPKLVLDENMSYEWRVRFGIVMDFPRNGLKASRFEPIITLPMPTATACRMIRKCRLTPISMMTAPRTSIKTILNVSVSRNNQLKSASASRMPSRLCP